MLPLLDRKCLYARRIRAGLIKAGAHIPEG
jgi:hypothetical protein